jgi:hypothetical protein
VSEREEGEERKRTNRKCDKSLQPRVRASRHWRYCEKRWDQCAEVETEVSEDAPTLHDERNEEGRVSRVVVLQTDTEAQIPTLSDEGVDVCHEKQRQNENKKRKCNENKQ